MSRENVAGGSEPPALLYEQWTPTARLTVFPNLFFAEDPSHATTVVLASPLLGASAGSLLAGRVGVRPAQRWGLLIALVLAAVNVGLSDVFRSTLGWPFFARALVTSVVAGGMGLFRGFPFPAGMIRFGERSKPWLLLRPSPFLGSGRSSL